MNDAFAFRDFDYWAKLPKWNWIEAPALICGLNPGYAVQTRALYSSPTKFLPRDAQADYDRVRRRMERAMPPLWRVNGAAPAQWLDLAKKFDIFVPPDLEAAVAKYASQTNAKARICDETACIEKLIEMMKASPDNPRVKAEVRRQDFPKLPERMFGRAWANASREAKAPAWSAPGPRNPRI